MNGREAEANCIPFPVPLSVTPHRQSPNSVRKRREGYSRPSRANIQGQIRQARPFGSGKADAPNGPFETLSP
jgi:hypothetical protein